MHERGAWAFSFQAYSINTRLTGRGDSPLICGGKDERISANTSARADTVIKIGKRKCGALMVEVAYFQSTESVIKAGLRYLTCPNSEFALSIDILVNHQNAELKTCPLVAYLFAKGENNNRAPIAIISFGNGIPPHGSVHSFLHDPPFQITRRGFGLGDDLPCAGNDQDPYRLYLNPARLFSLDDHSYPAIDGLLANVNIAEATYIDLFSIQQSIYEGFQNDDIWN